MDDRHPEAITVELGGKSRRLKLGPAAFRLARLKHATAISLADLQDISPDLLAQLVWIGLLPDEPELREEQVMVWMADGDEGACIKAAVTALHRMTDGITAAMDTGNPPTPTAT